MDLGFKYFWNSRDEFDAKMKNISAEKDLNEEGVRSILIAKVNATKFKYKTEKNYQGINNNPFDLIVGDEDNVSLAGFEIKSDLDNFNRLKAQLQAYLFVFNEVYLVLHKKEIPEWLPESVGVLRVFEDGECYVEKSSYFRDDMDISTDYEWDALFRSNGLGITSKRTRDVLRMIKDIKKNILFNRFFAVDEGYGSHSFKKFYPFSDREKSVLLGFDLPYHYKEIQKEITKLDERVALLKKIAIMGLKGLDEQITLGGENNGNRNNIPQR